MNRLGYIISVIDGTINAGLYFKDAKYYGLCEQAEKDGVLMPVRYTGSGDYEYVGFEDTWQLSTYHRIISQSSEDDQEGGFGLQTEKTDTYNMLMIVFGDMRKINDINESIRTKISDEFSAIFPSSFSDFQLSSLQINSGSIARDTISHNKKAIFEEETGLEYELHPEHFLFSIAYTIEVKYDGGCIEIECKADPEVLCPPCEPATVLDSDGVLEFEVQSGESGKCTECEPPPPITGLTCQQLNDGLAIAQRNMLQLVEHTQSGQTVIFTPGDDGDRGAGRLIDFFTLKCNNPFGNTYRFTDENGEFYVDPIAGVKSVPAAFNNNYAIDHAYNKGIYLVKGNGNWLGAFTYRDIINALAPLGFNDFYVPDTNMEYMIVNSERSQVARTLRYFPCQIGNFLETWSSTTNSQAVAQAKTLATISRIFQRNKVDLKDVILFRDHY